MPRKKTVKRKYKKEDIVERENERLEIAENEYWDIRHILSYNYMIFYILLGARERGKSYAVTNFFVSQFVKKGIPFIWIRLTDTAANKLLQNNAEKLVDPDLKRKYDLELRTSGNNVYSVKYETVEVKHKDGTTTHERREDKSKRKLMATVYCASTFYNDKGSIFDKDFLNDPKMYYHVGIDEFEREKGEKKTFDILYSVVNQLENILRSTKDRIRCFFIGNTLEEASEILCAFNFIPERTGTFQLVRNRKLLIQYIKELRACKNDAEKFLVNKKYKDIDFGKRCVIENIENSEAYSIRRKGTIADILMPTASTFTNKINTDNALIFKGALHSPNYVIKFTKNTNDWFTVWNSNIVCKWKNERKTVIAMRPYLDEMFNVKTRDNVITLFDTRSLSFRNLITFKQFQNQLELLKPRKG